MTQTFEDELARSSDIASPLRVVVPPRRDAVAAPLAMGDPEDVPGRIEVNSRYLTIDGAAWFPVMGEYHFSRDRPERWERELRKMKAGGINVVATYLIWILHEEVEGNIRWDGPRDLRRFVESADGAGLKVIIRIGPWAHGEARNGGFPDWLQSLPVVHRTNDPSYMRHAHTWYAAIEQQVRGLFHSPDNPGGPIIGVQVENELYDQPEHIAALRDLAESVGIRASLWTATGWGGAKLPANRVLPVYAGYSDGFWDESTTTWPDFGPMHFTFSPVRDDLTVGADVRGAAAEVGADASLGADDPWPFATCELGGGMAVAYHRRPHVDPADVAALALTKLGSGSAWQGYYMYHGGTQVQGELSTTQESHATAYPNDVPARDYDFAAPLSAHGVQRPHFHLLRQQHLFLEEFRAELLPRPCVLPESDSSGLRWAVRADSTGGFLFVNNHQPAVDPLPAVHDVQFDVVLEDPDTVAVPSRGAIAVPPGASFVWPLRRRYGAFPDVTVTAQPITRLIVDGRTLVFFAATDGIEVEMQLRGIDSGALTGAVVLGSERDAVVVRPHVLPGPECSIVYGDTTLVFLDSTSAASLWRGEIRGQDSIVLWRGAGWFDDTFHVEMPESATTISVVPALGRTPLTRLDDTGVFARYSVPGLPSTVLANPDLPAPVTAPVRLGGTADRLSAPTDDDFAGLPAFPIVVPDDLFDGADQLLLEVRWVGDVLRVHIGDEFVADQFWSGRDFEIDLTPYRGRLRSEQLTFKAFAWNPQAGVYVDARFAPGDVSPTLQVSSVRARPIRVVAIA
ncbi:beta-galactosidase [Microbacterium sp. NPDC056569]|uniref:beta-galactosidase n=1 Tax=Microbacterium sp. NPDC056569 TaxID=3345867 RepID=UPI003671A3EC